MTTTALPTKAVTVLAKCHGCAKINAKTEDVTVYPSGFWQVSSLHIWCECGKVTRGRESRRTAKKCGARCTGATGPSCDCECGGENHALHLRGH